MHIIIVILFLMSSVLSLAQISGQVKDFKTGKVMKDVEVFVDRSQITTLTDANGYFFLEGLPKGIVTIGCVKKGYRTGHKTIRVKEGENLLLFLMEKHKGKKLKDDQLRTEIVSSIFEKNSIIPAWNAQCMLTQSNLLIEETSASSRIFGQLDFNNLALGFKIKCHVLSHSPLQILTQYMPSRGNEDEQKNWDDNRFIAYQFTVNNFLESVLLNTAPINGYSIFNDQEVQINLDNQLEIGAAGQPNKLRLNEKIRVHHELGENAFDSWMKADGNVAFSDNGHILNSDSVKLDGTFTENSLTLQLPIEYAPAITQKRYQLEDYFERAYLHTDKPYYYPGDTLWFKAYMNFKTPFLIESLSKVLYVDLIGKYKGGSVLASRILKIEDGEAWGEFVLPDTLRADYVALHAYTNWQRNYSDPQVYQKFFPVVKRNQNLRNTRTEVQTNERVKIKFDKDMYSLREKIQFSVSVVNEQGTPVSAWMSVSVTDRSMVRAIEDSVTIDRAFGLKPIPATSSIRFPLEKGINLSGQYLNYRNKPTMVSIQLFSTQFAQAYEFNTDLYGKFAITGLNFIDSALVRYKVREGRYDLQGGKVILDNVQPLPLNLTWPGIYTDTEMADLKVEKNTTLLKEVIIRAKKIEEEKKKEDTAPKYVHTYGEPDFVLEGSLLNPWAVNVIEMMRGKVPGLRIAFNGIRYEIMFERAGSFELDTRPAVVIDDLPTGGDPVMTLLTLNPADVVSIEFIKRLTVHQSSLGGSGIIAVYTKAGGLRGYFNENSPYSSFKIRGYSIASVFRGVDHNRAFIPANSDFRTTLYWNPSVISSIRYGNDIVSFCASDSEGPYLVTIEGVTIEGKPFRTEQLIEINPK